MWIFKTVETILYCLLVLYFYLGAASIPKGHLLPLGSHREPEGHVAEIFARDEMSPQHFYAEFVNKSRPVVFRGALNDSAAVELWDDVYLKNRFGTLSVRVDRVKKEDRLVNSFQQSFSEFLDQYGTNDWYLIDTLNSIMGKDISIPECLKCGGFTHGIQDVVIWFSGGDTKSLFHFDTVENLNCQISGFKHWFLIDKKVHKVHEAINHMESDFSGVDVDAVDMYQYPQFQDVPWWFAKIGPGDCVYVPYKWFHYVKSYERNLAVNIWWTPFDSFNRTDCEEALSSFTSLDNLTFTPEMIRMNDDKVTFETANALFVAEHDGTKLISRAVFNMLDVDSDGLLIVEEVNQKEAAFFEENIRCKPGEINIYGKSEIDERDDDVRIERDNSDRYDNQVEEQKTLKTHNEL
ncbi:bifunctional peptidase and arginyl-hydroxylase JMJD5-like isoform X2 [Corticium candelabrum]|uniref:bifunctional peptidase and arginyl-hydroxylase JMJD5-like isoform X2 n=1 Tax=Corticium candelabrum TaxID=121492 RepID=UPI002E2555D5|nr:bifunctional peptidase and arginyl-hydroxylase JMJD5-like isoform X2 [Corticium candelabrum]